MGGDFITHSVLSYCAASAAGQWAGSEGRSCCTVGGGEEEEADVKWVEVVAQRKKDRAEASCGERRRRLVTR
jgi:hypothetical protein